MPGSRRPAGGTGPATSAGLKTSKKAAPRGKKKAPKPRLRSQELLIPETSGRIKTPKVSGNDGQRAGAPGRHRAVPTVRSLEDKSGLSEPSALLGVNPCQSSHVLATRTVPSAAVCAPQQPGLNFPLMTPKRSFVSPKQALRGGCDLPCRVSSESGRLRTGVKCRPGPPPDDPRRARVDNRSSAGSRAQPAATRTE